MTASITAVKVVGETDDAWLIEGLILPYGGPLYGQDLTGTHFTKSTDFCLDWFPDGGRPGLYAHGFDATVKTSVVGREVKSWLDDKGRWIQAQIDKAHEYGAEIKELVDQGLLSLSSGAVDHLVQIATKSGEIKRWPWVEWSLVPNPANPEALVYPVKSVDAVAHLTAVGVEDPVTVVEGGWLATKEMKITRAAIAQLERQGVTVDVKDDGIVVSRGIRAAADDASWAASLISSIAYIMADESAEPDQLDMLRNAIGWLQSFIDAELAEVGTPADIAEAAAEAAEATLEMMAWLSIRQAAPLVARIAATKAIADPTALRSLHESTKAIVATLGTDVPDSGAGAALLVITGPAAKAEPDLEALKAEMTAHATIKAREALGLT